MAHQYGCNTVVVRGCEVEDASLVDEAEQFRTRLMREGPSEELGEASRQFIARVQKKSQRQVDHLCRSLHTLLHEFPGTRLALEPGQDFLDLVNFESTGWILDDLSKHGLGYWHDTGRLHQRERSGLPPQGQWLDTYADRMLGVHLQDSAGDDVELPPGRGEVDFRLVVSYIARETERVIEIKPRHGRAEILSAVQYLVELGF